MEPHQNVVTMQRAYEAFNTGDMNTLTELMDETVWHLPGRSSMAGDYQGSGATLAYFGRLAEETGGTFRAELQHMTADGDNRVVGVQRSTADRNGKHLDVANCIVFELKDGKGTDGREHFEDLYGWDDFWSYPRGGDRSGWPEYCRTDSTTAPHRPRARFLGAVSQDPARP